MSSVERALQKLRLAREGQGNTARTAPLGRVTSGATNDVTQARISAPPSPNVARARQVEFDFSALREAGLFSAANQKLIDQYRLIKQPLLKKASEQALPGDKQNNLLMVASSLASEGKTFTSVNLSLSIATEEDWTVLLIDADCRKPHLTQLVGATELPGLLDTLRDPTVGVDSLILGTNIDGLEILPLGRHADHSAELLGSARMAQLCAELSASSQRRMVVFDSSPVLLTSEAPILAAHMGQIVMVVLANQTPRHAVEQAIEKLDPSKAISLILNRADNAGGALAYGYGYGDIGANPYQPSSSP